MIDIGTISFLTHKHHLHHTKGEVIFMAKQGMKRPESEHKKNSIFPVPEISGKAKSGKIKANPLIAGADGKVYHSIPHAEDAIPAVFPAIDNDLAVENFVNDFDMTAADLHDLQ